MGFKKKEPKVIQNVIKETITKYKEVTEPTIKYVPVDTPTVKYEVESKPTVKYEAEIKPTIQYEPVYQDTIKYNPVMEKTVQYLAEVQPTVRYDTVNKETVKYVVTEKKMVVPNVDNIVAEVVDKLQDKLLGMLKATQIDVMDYVDIQRGKVDHYDVKQQRMDTVVPNFLCPHCKKSSKSFFSDKGKG
jgi:hypothetical protein